MRGITAKTNWKKILIMPTPVVSNSSSIIHLAHHLKMTGILGILLRARKSGKIASLSEKLDALRNTRFWLSVGLTDRLLREAGERP
ncbi:MAG: DUF3368 domain-containing protein [Candidatus Contendobacter sp.]